MNNSNLRWSFSLKEKYKADLGLVRDILEEKLDSLASPSKSQLTFEETSSQQSSSSKLNHKNPSKMADKEEASIEDIDE